MAKIISCHHINPPFSFDMQYPLLKKGPLFLSHLCLLLKPPQELCHCPAIPTSAQVHKTRNQNQLNNVLHTQAISKYFLAKLKKPFLTVVMLCMLTFKYKNVHGEHKAAHFALDKYIYRYIYIHLYIFKGNANLFKGDQKHKALHPSCKSSCLVTTFEREPQEVLSSPSLWFITAAASPSVLQTL